MRERRSLDAWVEVTQAMLQEEKYCEKKGVEEGTLDAVCFGDANSWVAVCCVGVRGWVRESCCDSGGDRLGGEEGSGDGRASSCGDAAGGGDAGPGNVLA